jgi:hypothetical protein
MKRQLEIESDNVTKIRPLYDRIVVKRIGSVGLPVRAKHMKRINFAVTVDELRLLASLASDQLFRRQFIDPKIPGYKSDPEEVNIGKALVGRMRLIIDGNTRPYHISPRA